MTGENMGCVLRGQVEPQLDTMLIQFDPVLAAQQLDVELPLKARTDLVYLEGALDVSQRFRRRDCVDGGQPCDGASGMPGLQGETKVFDFVATWAEADQAIKTLDQSVVVVTPYLVGFVEVPVTGICAYLTDMTCGLESDSLQALPGVWVNVRPDVAVPASDGNKFNRKLH